MAEFVKQKIIGTWKLVSWTYNDQHGNEIDYFGKEAVGLLMYDSNGYMNAQLMKNNREKFEADSINGGRPEETKKAFDTYIAYFGRYEEARPGEIVHTVEGSLFPNWLNNQEVRYAMIEGNRLKLSTPPIPVNGTNIVFYITWEKVNIQ
jgi:hypothetical protein